jgi:hypothetical protein
MLNNSLHESKNNSAVSAVINKIDSMNSNGVDLYSQLESLQEDVEYLTEEEYNRVTRHLSLEMLDIEQFISKNNCQRISNPIFYDKAGVPTEDGLMSDKIFGMTQYDRGGIFAYIDLFCMYNSFILYTGKNYSNGNYITLIFDVYGKKLATYEEYKEKMKDYL